MTDKKATLALSHIESRILFIRGHKVLLDSDLAELYGVETGRLNEQVRRNAKRFPKDFIFSLENHDIANLRSQSAISSSDSTHGGRRYKPIALLNMEQSWLLRY